MHECNLSTQKPKDIFKFEDYETAWTTLPVLWQKKNGREKILPLFLLKRVDKTRLPAHTGNLTLKRQGSESKPRPPSYKKKIQCQKQTNKPGQTRT